MLEDTENTSDQFITRLAVDMVDIHLKFEYFNQEKPLIESSLMELTLYNLL